MANPELKRLIAIEERVREIAKEKGLLTTEIDFEIVPAQRMLEGMAYMFPTNFSHWSFGRDYDKHRTIFEHTGAGIPYEQVWNFDHPRTLIVDSNPFALKVLVITHVYGHVDYFLSNRYLQYSRTVSDIAEEARHAAQRFREYEEKYGKDIVEKTIDAGMSIQWQQSADPFLEEEFDDEIARQRLIALVHAKLENKSQREFERPRSEKEIEKIRKYLGTLSRRTPPEPIYDLLGYIIQHSPVLRSWQQDVLTVIRNQARALAPNRRTKIANEGWATYWHVQIMRQLFSEGLLTTEEHRVFNDFHSAVTSENKLKFNWYRIGLAIFEYIKEQWDKGRFGPEYDACVSPMQRAYWDTQAHQGTEKIFQVHSRYSDRMIIEEFFTDEFIRAMQLYLYEESVDQKGIITYTIIENRPEVIRQALKHSFTLYGVTPIKIENANHDDQQRLYLKHDFGGLELDPLYRNGTMEHLYFLWGKKVLLETVTEENKQMKQTIVSYDGQKHKVEK